MSSTFRRLSPYIRIAQEVTLTKPWEQSESVVLNYMLLYIKEGRVKLTIDNTELDAMPRDMFLLKPGQLHSAVLSSPDGIILVVHFDLFLRDDSEWLKVPFIDRKRLSEAEIQELHESAANAGLEMVLPMRLGVRSVAHVEELVYDIIESHKETKPYSEMRARGQFLMLLSYILDEHRIVTNPDKTELLDQYRDIHDYIEVNFQKPITLETLAGKFGISPFHMQKMFKRIYGISPFRYLTLLRISKAREMLEKEDTDIAQIVSDLCFGSMFAFCRAFQREVGLTPSAYRHDLLIASAPQHRKRRVKQTNAKL